MVFLHPLLEGDVDFKSRDGEWTGKQIQKVYKGIYKTQNQETHIKRLFTQDNLLFDKLPDTATVWIQLVGEQTRLGLEGQLRG